MTSTTLTVSPLYKTITSAIEQQILAGTLAPGTRLKPETSFAQDFGVSRQTVTFAIGLLRAKGLVARRQGLGTIVMPIDTAGPAQRGVLELHDHSPDDIRLVRLHHEERPAGCDGALFGIAPTARVVRTTHALDAGGLTIAVMHDTLLPSMFSPDKPVFDPQTGALMLAREPDAVRTQTVSAGLSSSDPHLAAEYPKPVLTLTRRHYGQSGQLVRAGTDFYLGESFTYRTVLSSR